MLTSQDDLIGHQTSAPFARVGNTDPRFTERYWYTAHPIDGRDLIIDLGLGYYPNRGVMDAFAGMTIGRQQHTFRASRSLASQPLKTAVGPLQFEVLEGFKRHRMTLAENDSGISFELEFEGSFPVAHEKQSFRERKGELYEDLARMTQFGRFRGWIKVAGIRYDVEPATWWGQRDRSWGVRAPMLTDESLAPVKGPTQFFWTWAMCQFENLGVLFFIKERDPDKPWYLSGSEFRRHADGQISHREITSVSHEIQWADDPHGQTIAVADYHLQFAEGPARDLRMQGLPARFYLKAGLYGGLNGWNHGDDRGAYHSEHQVWNLEDAATRVKARTLADHVMRGTSDGLTGYGISEYGVSPGYPKYLAQQCFPAI
jgi:hypothetical protein